LLTVDDLVTAIADLDPADAPAVLAAVAARLAKARSIEALPQPEPAASDDTNLTIEQAAKHICRSTKWIYRHREQLPFVRKLGPRSYIISKNALDRWLARGPC
jgi:predicted DNA-binding transcriptional regulator AlpA